MSSSHGDRGACWAARWLGSCWGCAAAAAALPQPPWVSWAPAVGVGLPRLLTGSSQFPVWEGGGGGGVSLTVPVPPAPHLIHPHGPPPASASPSCPRASAPAPTPGWGAGALGKDGCWAPPLAYLQGVRQGPGGGGCVSQAPLQARFRTLCSSTSWPSCQALSAGRFSRGFRPPPLAPEYQVGWALPAGATSAGGGRPGSSLRL